MVYRAALIGCGKIGSEFSDDPLVKGIYSHAAAYTACSSTKLVAVCDTDPIKLDRCLRRWGVEAGYDSPGQLFIEQQPEIISICTPDNTHYEIIRAAILTPGIRAVLAEKPLALTLNEAAEITTLSEEHGVLLAVNYTRRYVQSHIRLREFIHAGGIGQIQTLGGYYTKGVMHNGTHWFDLARFLAGEVVAGLGINVRKDYSLDPTLDAFLEFSCGASAFLHGCDASRFTLFEMDLIGARGRVRIIESGHSFEIYQVVDSPYYTGYKALGRDDVLTGGLEDALLNAVEDLVDCLDKGGSPRCTGRDALIDLKIARAIIESSETGTIRPIGAG
jgi:predicted dehydrogenase